MSTRTQRDKEYVSLIAEQLKHADRMEPFRGHHTGLQPPGERKSVMKQPRPGHGLSLSKPSSIKDLCERIFALEAEHGLLDLQVDGVKIWQYRRVRAFDSIAQALGIMSDTHPIQRDLISVLKRRYHNAVSILLHSPFRYAGQIDTLVFDHVRSKSIDGKPADIYTYFLLEKLRREGKRVLVIEGAWHGVHVRPATCERRHIEAINLRTLVDRIVGRYRCSQEGMLRIEELNRLICRSFAVDIDLRPLLREAVTRFQSDIRSYSQLLARLRPTCIYLVVGYSHYAPLVQVARHMGIKTVELQHGASSRYHLGYSFPGQPTLDYFADVIESWGSYWSEMEELPLPRERIIDSGFSYFHYMRKRHAGIRRRKDQLLVLSQTPIGASLAERVLRVVELGSTEHITIMYKLHPGEYLSWRKYPALARLANMPNIEIIDRDCDLYHLFAESEYQTGVFSTAIFEGIQMGCKTMLFRLPGVEHMEKLANKGLAVYFSENSTLEENLRLADSIALSHRSEELFGFSV